ncbi:hypothetical protein ACNKHT_10405 [Shigella flexneri]
MTCDGWQKKKLSGDFRFRASYLDDVERFARTTCRLHSWTEHLIRNGHQQIARLGGQSSSLTRAERVGLCATLLKFGLPFHSDWV